MKNFVAAFVALAVLIAGVPAFAQFDGGLGNKARAHPAPEWHIHDDYPVSGTSINFTAPAGCRSIRIMGSVFATTNTQLGLQFNGDTTGAHYTTERVYAQSTSGSALGSGTTGYIYISDTPANSNTYPSSFVWDVFDVGSAVFGKTTLGYYGVAESGTFYTFRGSGYWNSTAPIFSYQLILQAGTFVTPSRISWYCVN